MKNSAPTISRRQFLGRSLVGAVWVTTHAGAVRQVAAAKQQNPFAYDIERFTRTDPKLVRYEETRRFACPQPEPRRLCLDAEDRVYVAAANHVCVFSKEGEQLREWPVSGKARCVAVAADSTAYVGLRDHVEVFDGRGRQTAAWETPGKRAWFTGLAATETDVFAADAGNRVVLRYDRSGKLVGRIGQKDKEKNVLGLIVPSPYLTVKPGHDGLLRVNNPGRHRVELYTTDGDLELWWGKPGAAIEGFCGCCNPIALAMLPDGRCITGEKGFPRVKVFGADGSFECVVAGPESFPENAKAGSARDSSDGNLGGLDVEVDSKGRIYVLDLVSAEIRVMIPKAEA